MSISNLFFWSWQAFEACSWEAQRVFFKGIIVSFDVFLLVYCVCGAIKRCCIVDRISPFGIYSII